ncbi:MAG TPA: 30S ribosomal protein S21 [Patescibacteria group bacterium]
MSDDFRPRSRENSDRSDRPRGRENFEVVLRRFFREVQQSGILTEAKRKRFFEKDTSRKLKRTIAQRKADRKRITRGY